MTEYLSKVIYVLSEPKRNLIPLLFSFILVSILEVFGIGVIGPFIAMANNPILIEQNSGLQRIYEYSGIENRTQFIALTGLGIILIFCIKSFLSWKIKTSIFRFSFKQKAILTNKLMKAYLFAPYTFHLNKSSSDIIQNVITETKEFTSGVLSPLLDSSANVIIVTFLIVLLAITNTVTLILVLGITLPLFFFFNSFKSKLNYWGKEASLADRATIRIINHGLGGIKETKILGCESYFEHQIIYESNRYVDAVGNFFAFRVSPRIVIETFLIIFLIGLVSVYLFLGKDIQQLTATLSVFVIASIRLIPAISNITNEISILKNSSFSLNKLYSDIQGIENYPTNDYYLGINKKTTTNLLNQNNSLMSFKEKIEIKSLSYKYPKSSDLSLHNLSLEINKGESIALIGKSGAGKTTLVDVILGLLIPSDGDIRVDGQSIYRENLRSWQNLVGYIPQSIFLIDDSIEKNVAFGIPEKLIDRQKIARVIEKAQLKELVEKLPQGIETIVGERGVLLSGGQRQRIGIARALYHEREILVLDEATAALDEETETLVTKAIKSLAKTKTTIVIAHRLSTVEHCDRIYEMDRGRIVRSGSYEEIVLGKKGVF